MKLSSCIPHRCVEKVVGGLHTGGQGNLWPRLPSSLRWVFETGAKNAGPHRSSSLCLCVHVCVAELGVLLLVQPMSGRSGAIVKVRYCSVAY
jgi:hypothetical protein